MTVQEIRPAYLLTLKFKRKFLSNQSKKNWQNKTFLNTPMPGIFNIRDVLSKSLIVLIKIQL